MTTTRAAMHQSVRSRRCIGASPHHYPSSSAWKGRISVNSYTAYLESWLRGVMGSIEFRVSLLATSRWSGKQNVSHLVKTSVLTRAVELCHVWNPRGLSIPVACMVQVPKWETRSLRLATCRTREKRNQALRANRPAGQRNGYVLSESLRPPDSGRCS